MVYDTIYNIGRYLLNRFLYSILRCFLFQVDLNFDLFFKLQKSFFYLKDSLRIKSFDKIQFIKNSCMFFLKFTLSPPKNIILAPFLIS